MVIAGLMAAALMQSAMPSGDLLAERGLDYSSCAIEASRFTARLAGSLEEAVEATVHVCRRERDSLKDATRRSLSSSSERDDEMATSDYVARAIARLYIIRDRSCGSDAVCNRFFSARGLTRR